MFEQGQPSTAKSCGRKASMFCLKSIAQLGANDAVSLLQIIFIQSQ